MDARPQQGVAADNTRAILGQVLLRAVYLHPGPTGAPADVHKRCRQRATARRQRVGRLGAAQRARSGRRVLFSLKAVARRITTAPQRAQAAASGTPSTRGKAECADERRRRRRPILVPKTKPKNDSRRAARRLFSRCVASCVSRVGVDTQPPMRLLTPAFVSAPVCAPTGCTRQRAPCLVGVPRRRRNCSIRADGTVALGESADGATSADGNAGDGLPPRVGWSSSTLAIHGGAS